MLTMQEKQCAKVLDKYNLAITYLIMHKAS